MAQKKGDTVASPSNVPVRTKMYDFFKGRVNHQHPMKSDNFCFSSNPKHPKRSVVLVWLRSDGDNIPLPPPVFDLTIF